MAKFVFSYSASDGRTFRLIQAITQTEVFHSRLDPAKEGIIKLKDRALILPHTPQGTIFRVGEYGFMKSSPTHPFGEEIIYLEDGKRFNFRIPSVDVELDGEKVPLQSLSGFTGIIPIEALRHMSNRYETVVSESSPGAFETRLILLKFENCGPFCCDARGLPRPDSSGLPEARTYVFAASYDWHGSLGVHHALIEGVSHDFLTIGLQWSDGQNLVLLSHLPQ